MIDLGLRARAVVRISNMKISRRHLAKYVKKLHQKACRSCSTVNFLHSTNQSSICGLVVPTPNVPTLNCRMAFYVPVGKKPICSMKLKKKKIQSEREMEKYRYACGDPEDLVKVISSQRRPVTNQFATTFLSNSFNAHATRTNYS